MRANLLALAAVLACISLPLLAGGQAASGANGSAASTQADGAEADNVRLRRGTRILLRTTAEISSRTARKGDLIALEVNEPVTVDGIVAIPAGTPAIAELTVAEKKGMMGQAGKLAARMLYLEMPQGPVRVSGELASVGRDQTGLAVVATGLTMGFAFFVTGKTAVIPEGTELGVMLDREALISRDASDR